jgi:hypothetical protein
VDVGHERSGLTAVDETARGGPYEGGADAELAREVANGDGAGALGRRSKDLQDVAIQVHMLLLWPVRPWWWPVAGVLAISEAEAGNLARGGAA